MRSSAEKNHQWITFVSLSIFCSYMFSVLTNVIAGDTITPTLSLSDGQTIVSAGTNFEMGFFSPGESQNRYLGIWYNKISNGSVVWIANRETPLNDKFGVLKISNNGNLVLLNRTESVVWASNSSKKTQNPIAQLLDTGNLVLRDKNQDDSPDNYAWQSFDHPSDTLLPGMKLGWNLRTGLNRVLTSWKAVDDPSPGDYRFGIDIHGFPQLVLWKGENFQYRSGSWNGLRFTGTPQLNENPVFEFNFVFNQEEVYYYTLARNNAVVTELVLNLSGTIHRITWNDRNRDWVLYTSLPLDQCDTYNLCGAYGTCNMDNSPICQCLEGFVPKSPNDWGSMDWSNGCTRRSMLSCGKEEGFRKYAGVRLPDTRKSWYSMTMSLGECEEECLKNCSCSAYASLNIKDGTGCLLWFGDLIDVRKLIDKGQDLYVKMPASELEHDSKSKKRLILVVTGTLVLSGMLLLGLVTYICKIKKQKKEEDKTPHSERKYNTDEDTKDELELPIFDFVRISTATDNFSSDNKLGEGGFGPVYKGKLLEGQEIAVKRLSRNTAQGLSEFKSEVKLIAKLQHRNLVRLLGCCIQGEERMLIYEYMPNKSLDFFIFDQTRSSQLDWQKRNHIINGITRGLLYLHQDSRLRIVHRDLKASNILLDNDMNPKISDFGLARSLGGNEIEANTSTVVGTYGYMSPEYTMDGLFSVKSDVFSFGVLVLEIVTGKKNRGFYHGNRLLNLLGHVWRLWNEGNPLELIDASIENSCTPSEVLRCMHVGLLCVQQCPEDRPSMSSVVLMLGSETTNLPPPSHPGFFLERNSNQTDSSSSNKEFCTAIDMTITLLESR